MRLEGSLEAFSLPDIFSLLSMTKKTGGLHLRRASSHGVVWLGDGQITGGSSDLSALSLGHRLAGVAEVSDEALSTAAEAVRADREIGIAAALKAAGAIDAAAVQAAVAEHIIDTVFDLMRWPDGVFQFAADESNSDDVGVTRPVDDVVTEARRRLEAWGEIDPAIAAPDAVLGLVLEPGKDLKLDNEEWSLLALVDGRRTVSDLVRLCGRGEFSVVVALAALAGRGLIAATDAAGRDGVASLVRRQGLITSVETGAQRSDDDSPDVITDADLHEVDDAETIEDAADETTDEVSDDEVSDDESSAPDRVELHSVAPVLALAEDIVEDDYNADIDFTITAEQNREAAELTSVLNNDGAGRVTPQRPEPFLPSREPDHPEPLAVAAGGSVATPMPSGLIERDPSVNKSLLLRLIAGVRGL